MKKFLIYLAIIIFCMNGIALAKSEDKGKSKHNEKAKIEKNNKEKIKKEDPEADEDKVKEYNENKAGKEDTEKVRGKKVEPPEGVQNAAEKGKGKKKGLFERWFGSDKEE